MSRMFTALMSVLSALPMPTFKITADKKELSERERDRRRAQSLVNHRPTTTHRHKDGATYYVTASGAWVRTDGHRNHQKRHRREALRSQRGH